MESVNLNQLYKSIAQIRINKNQKPLYGFFMKIKISSQFFYFLFFRIINISEEIFMNISEIDIILQKKKEITIKVDKNERFIYIAKELAVIEILQKDKNFTEDIYLSPDYNYLNEEYFYNNNNNSKIFQLYSPKEFGDKKIVFGKINKIIDKNKFAYILDSQCFSPEMPILNEWNNVVGLQISVNNNNNIGIFMGIIINSIKKKMKNLEKLSEKLPDESQKEIYKLDKIIKRNCSPQKDYYEFFHFLKNSKNPEYFVNVSIFDKYIYNSKYQEFINKFLSKNFTELEKSCIGSILGMAIGDAIGARVEFLPLDYHYNEIRDMGKGIAGKFNLEPGQWTDDSSMGFCIADSLIENKGNFDPRDIMMRFILWWFCGYNNAFRLDKCRKKRHSVGLGGNIKGSLKEYIKNEGKDKYTKYGDKNTSGNGSIMRNAAIPICYFREEKEALENAKNQSLITHQGDEASFCCQLLTFIIVKILKIKEALIKEKQFENKNNMDNLINYSQEKNIQNILDNLDEFNCSNTSVKLLSLSKQEGNNKNRNWNWKDPEFKYSEERAHQQPGYIGSYCMDGLSMALHVLYNTNNFKDAILKAGNLCGDSDSVASVVGQIAGAFYGLDNIPEDWIKTINQWDNSEIAFRGYLLCHLKENEKNIKK